MNYLNPLTPSKDFSRFDSIESSKKEEFLFIIKEIEIGTPDSIELAIQCLKAHGIEIDSLTLLAKHFVSSSPRDEAFHQKVKELQYESIIKIKKILNN